MMNEFIVWDEDLECFRVEDDFLLDTEDRVCNSNGELLDEETYKPFKSIGKTDIEGKKIYAESSIVEFEIDLSHKIEVKRGFISYDYECLCYRIQVKNNNINHGFDYYEFSHYDIENLKIIGTLQQDKELLDEK